MKKLFITLLIFGFVVTGGNAIAENGYGPAENTEAVSEAQSDASITTIDNSKSKVFNRQFVNPGITPLPQTNGFFTAPTPDSSFRSIKDILRVFGDGHTLMITEGALEKWAKGGDVESHLQVARGADQVPRIYSKDCDKEKWLGISIEKPIVDNGRIIGVERIEGLTVTGLMDGEADDGDTNSVQVIGKVGLKVLKNGNNHMVVTAEGAHRMVEASGWGIGLYTVGGSISNDGKESGLVGGGTGYAKNRVGPEDRPWIQGYFGCVGEAKPVKVDTQTGNHKPGGSTQE